MSSPDARDRGMRAHDEARLFDTDLDSDPPSDVDVVRAPTTTRPSPPDELSVSAGDSVPERPSQQHILPETSLPSPTLGEHPRDLPSSASPAAASTEPASPTPISPLRTPGALSHRPRPRTRTRTRRARSVLPTATQASVARHPSLPLVASPSLFSAANVLHHHLSSHNPVSPAFPVASPVPTATPPDNAQPAARNSSSLLAASLQLSPSLSDTQTSAPQIADGFNIHDKHDHTHDHTQDHALYLMGASTFNETDEQTHAVRHGDDQDTVNSQLLVHTTRVQGASDPLAMSHAQGQVSGPSSEVLENLSSRRSQSLGPASNRGKAPNDSESLTKNTTHETPKPVPQACETQALFSGIKREQVVSEPADAAVDWEFWGNVLTDYQRVTHDQPDRLAKAIQDGVPPTIRGALWQCMSGDKDDEVDRFYTSCAPQESPYDKAIRRDLSRTYPHQAYFRPGSRGQDELFQVMKAYALYDRECGYCQGMQFLVGSLLLHMPEEDAFRTWVHLMKRYNLRGHFLPGMPTLELQIYQFSRLVEDIMPTLHAHLVRQGVKTSMYASPWFLTAFCYRFPLELAFRVLDMVFLEGLDCLFRFAVLLLKKNEKTLLSFDFENAVLFLKERILDVYRVPVSEDEVSESASANRAAADAHDAASNDAPESEKLRSAPRSVPLAEGPAQEKLQFDATAFFGDAADMAERIRAMQLDRYAEEYRAHVAKMSAPLQELETLRQNTWNMAAHVKELEQDQELQATAHMELMKQVVAATLAKDEVEEQLVQYKTLYAEATLARERVIQEGQSGAADGTAQPQGKEEEDVPAQEHLLPEPGAAQPVPPVMSPPHMAQDASSAHSSSSGVAQSVSATVASWGKWMSLTRPALARPEEASEGLSSSSDTLLPAGWDEEPSSKPPLGSTLSARQPSQLPEALEAPDAPDTPDTPEAPGTLGTPGEEPGAARLEKANVEENEKELAEPNAGSGSLHRCASSGS